MTNPIYKPKDAADEYAEYAINVALECSNGCRYCYVPQVLRESRTDFVKEPKSREGIARLSKGRHRKWT